MIPARLYRAPNPTPGNRVVVSHRQRSLAGRHGVTHPDGDPSSTAITPAWTASGQVRRLPVRAVVTIARRRRAQACRTGQSWSWNGAECAGPCRIPKEDRTSESASGNNLSRVLRIGRRRPAHAADFRHRARDEASVCQRDPAALTADVLRGAASRQPLLRRRP